MRARRAGDSVFYDKDRRNLEGTIVNSIDEQRNKLLKLCLSHDIGDL